MDELQQRGKALENKFFSEKDAELLQKLKSEMASEQGQTELAAATGIADAAALKSIVDAGISVESLTSVGLIPLVAVAWSDGRMEDSEKSAILKAAEGAGIASGSSSFQLLEGWLADQPSGDLLDAWKSYVGALKGTIDETAFGQLKTSVLGRAQSVAEAAGGFLGLGNKVSASEQKVLDELTNAF